MKITILSRGPQLYSTQRLLRAGLRRGHLMRIVDHTRCHFFLEKGRGIIYYDGLPMEVPDAIIPRIGSSVTSLGAALIQQFENMNVITATRSSALLQSRDKLRCLQKLASCGLEVPATAYVSNTENLIEIIDRVGGFPVVIKLLESTHGVGVILAETLKNAESTIEAFHKLRERVLVQEFIREAQGADVRALVVSGKIVASMKRQARPGEFRSNLHRGATADPVQLSKREKDVILRAVQIMGLDIAGVDILRSSRGPMVLEVNSSPGLEGIETTTNVDIAGSIIQFLEHRWRLKQERQQMKKNKES